MKKISIALCTVFFLACNNSKNEKATTTDTTVNTNENVNNNVTSTTGDNTGEVDYTADGVAIRNSASVLVSKDKDKLKADAPFICILTSTNNNNNGTLTLNFLLDTKPGTYPVVGSSFMRGESPNDHMFGSILGGEPKITSNTVTITECKDLGSNNVGGHKWSISGHFDEITIAATPIMLMDKSKNHPAEVKIKGSFSNLTFDDNWEELMEKAMEHLQKKQ